MAAQATILDLSERLPSADEAENARRLLELLELLEPLAEPAKAARITIEALGRSASHEVSPAVARMLVGLLRQLSAGRAVTLVPVGGMLTTQQAADVLNVSRPYLIKLIDNGELHAVKVGRHRRLQAADVLTYKRAEEQRRDESLARMAAVDADYL